MPKVTITQPEFLAVDFYCGAGGTSNGLLQAGAYLIAGLDNDATCQETYQSNNKNNTLDRAEPAFLNYDLFPETPLHPEGQQSSALAELNRLIPNSKLAAPQAPLLFAISAPCQPFSKFVQRTLTDRQDQKRKRDSSLLTQTLTFIKAFKPDLIISENVPTIAKGVYKDSYAQFQQELLKLGYQVNSSTICAADFGVAQYRRRSIMLAMRHPTPCPNLPFPEQALYRQTTVRQAIGHLPPLQPGQADPQIPNHQCTRINEINQARLRALPCGASNQDLPPHLMLNCHRQLNSRKTSGFSDPYTRMYPDRPAPTITTRFNSISNGRYGHFDPDQPRGLSLHEGALLQSFPESYTFTGTTGAIARMIGNAVPPKLAQATAQHLLKNWRQNNENSNQQR